MEGRTIIPFRRRDIAHSEEQYMQQPGALRPRYRPFHQPLTRARQRECENEPDIWQMLSPDVAEALRAKRALARELRQKAQTEMSDC